MSFFWCKEQITIGLALNAHYQRSLMMHHYLMVFGEGKALSCKIIIDHIQLTNKAEMPVLETS